MNNKFEFHFKTNSDRKRTVLSLKVLSVIKLYHFNWGTIILPSLSVG